MARYAGGTLALALIVILCFFFLFLLPHGLTGITSSSIMDDGITFRDYEPTGDVEIIGDCYPVTLQLDYYFNCAMCTSKDVREYFWFRESGDSDFTFLKGERKTIKPSQIYAAEMEVQACAGESYEWYFCIDDGTLKCAGRTDYFAFNALD